MRERATAAVREAKQGEYLTGYYPVIFLAIYDKYGMVPVSDVMTGPLFVMQDTAAEVIELSAKGYQPCAATGHDPRGGHRVPRPVR